MRRRTDIDDAALVARQIGRAPREPWRVAVRCRKGSPQAIASPPRLADSTPFPTLYWLTCPHLLRAAAKAESAGGSSLAAAELAADGALAARMRAADAAYRRARAEEAGGTDVLAHVGVAGQREPLATKCLHAHVAAALAGLDDPLGIRLLEAAGRECGGDECEPLARACEAAER